ncbi:MAG: hypothetical protein MZV64_20855 [Ignavibacteriales bacterium]|nr:hypothetical protein [Ignavibacteriales bacterium]
MREAAARWVAGRLQEAGLKPGAGDTSWFQWFPNAWTEVSESRQASPSSPVKDLSAYKENKTAIPGGLLSWFQFSLQADVIGEVVCAGFGNAGPGTAIMTIMREWM